MHHLTTLGTWVATVDTIPDDVRRAARAQMLDMAAAASATARTGIAKPVVDAVAAMGSSGRSTSLADGARLAPVEAAIVNAALSMAHDFDDIVWMGHTCHSAVFAALAVGEHLGSTTAEVVDAVVVANEVAGRLGASSLLGPLNGQMWTFVHLIGAAAAGARLLRLDAERTTHALAIALAQPNFGLQPGFLRPTSKLLAASTPTATGVRAAFFARAGMTGAPELLEDPRGFWARFSFLPLPGMLGDLGELWVLRTLAVKTYPGCHYFQTALAALDKILARQPELPRASVRRVRADTTKLGMEATRFATDSVAGGEWTAVSVNFDLAQSLAVMLHARAMDVEQLEDGWLRANGAELRAWRGLIEVRHDLELTARTIASGQRIRAGRSALRSIAAMDLVRLVQQYRREYRSNLVMPTDLVGLVRAVSRRRRRKEQPEATSRAIPLDFPNRVTIELASGQILQEQVDTPPGSLSCPDFERVLETKALRELGSRMGEARARQAIDATWTLAAEPATSLAATWVA